MCSQHRKLQVGKTKQNIPLVVLFVSMNGRSVLKKHWLEVKASVALRVCHVLRCGSEIRKSVQRFWCQMQFKMEFCFLAVFINYNT